MRKSGLWVVGFAMLLTAPSPTVGQPPAGNLKVHFLNVGQADAIYVECPDAQHNMLIDSGDVTAMRYPGSPKLFQDQIKTLLGDRKRIDLVVSTHPHSDHAGSLLWVLNTYEVGTFIDDGMTYDSATYKNIEQRATELSGQGKLSFLHATALQNAGPEANFCPTPSAQTVLLKPGNFGNDANPNNNSVVVRLKYGTEAFLFTGDAETEEEDLLLGDPATKALLPATVLKAPHHGSNTSSSQGFLDVVHPNQVVVSAGEKDVGTNAGYKHPRAETLRRFLQFTSANGTADQRNVDAYDTASKKWTTVQINQGVYVTAKDGPVVLISDGQKTWKEGSLPADETNSPVRYVYTKNSSVYHFAECADAKKIKPENRVESATPPKGKELHRGCPR